jgi:DNA-binding SARP family transcriptional activator
MARLQLELLGGFSVRLDGGEACVLPTRKAQALLAYLALPAGRFHSREKLTALLWGDTAEAQARQSFRQALASIRRAVGAGEPPVLFARGDTIALNAALVSVDAADLEAALAGGSPGALARMTTLYKGDLLDGFAVDETSFEEWRVVERERLRELALEGLAKLLREQLRADQPEPAIQTALRILGIDPLQEAVHRVLMRLLLRQGRRAAALQQYHVCIHVLRRELGTGPETETRLLYRQLLQAPSAPASRGGVRIWPEAARPVGTLIGRRTELHALRQAWEMARDGEGRLVFVLGETGIGKSRLVAELTADAADGGTRVAVGRAYGSASVQPFGVWVDAVRTAGLLDDIDVGRPALIELGRLFPELEAPRPLATMAPGHAAQARLFEALAELCQRVAAASPLVLVLEDLQWADEMSLELLSFLSDRIPAWPALVIGTARSEELAAVPGLRRVLERLAQHHPDATLELSPLSREDTSALIRAHARPVDRADASLLGQIWNVSAGNPLVIVESVRALYDQEVPAHIALLPLPKTVGETIGRRLDRLGEPAAQVAAVVAVIGRAFDFELLHRVTLLEASEAAAAIEQLVGSGVLHAVGERLAMTHERIQQAAYERLLAPAQRLWHQRVAESLEALARERGEPLEPATLAHHLAEAGLVPQAVEHLSLASQRAIEQSAYGEAIAHARRGLAFLARLPDPVSRLSQELSTQLRLGEALIATRGYAAPEVQTAFARAREVCIEMGQPAQIFPAVAGLFHYYLTRGDVQAAATLAAQLLEMAQAGPIEHRIIAHLASGDAAFWGGELEVACEHLARTLELAQGGAGVQASFGGHDALVVSELYGAITCWLLGEADTALARIERATRRAQDLEHPHSETLAMFFAAWLHRLRGEPERAGERLHDLLALSTRGGFSFWVLVATLTMGHRLAELGDPVAGVAQMEQALVAYRAAGAELGLTFLLTLLAEAQQWAGRPGDALHTVAQAEALARTNGERFYEAELLRLRGDLLAVLSVQPLATSASERLVTSADPRDSEGCYREALRIARAQGARALELRAATSLGLWLGRHGGDEEARTTVVELYGSFTEGLETEDLERARRLIEVSTNPAD